jgi:Secretion system C-terminal sorting domain
MGAIMMRVLLLTFCLSFIIQLSSLAQGTIIDHNCTEITQIPESEIVNAKDNLHIAYGHTSHGSQIITGMNNLDTFMGAKGLYKWNDGVESGALDIDDYFMSGDLGNPDRTTWADRTREYLNNNNNSEVNVIIWSWCGQVSSATEDDINTYLDLMNQLEIDFPNISFIYMTGHLDGSGLMGNLHLRNEQIRNFCKTNSKFLFDFADIECYDPDGNYFGDKIPNDNCDYDTDGDGSRDGNWALEWQSSHTVDVDWYSCSAAHSQSLNGNLKAYAAWWLWATLAGWDGVTTVENTIELPHKFELKNNYPNPFNPTTNITFSIPQYSNVRIEIFNSLGQLVRSLFNQNYDSGNYTTIWNARDDFGNKVNSGVYIYRLVSENYVDSKRMVLMK